MNRKTIIQLVIIIAAFGGSGVVLYNGFFKKPALPVIQPLGVGVDSSGTAGGSPASTGPILPYGRTLDFSQLNKFQFGAVDYQQINTSTELCVPVDELIRVPSQTATPCPPSQ